VRELNRRFSSGRSSNSLAEAGVLVHMFDNLEDWSAGRGFAPCDSGWCKGLEVADHWACSLINSKLTGLFSSNAGIVLASHTRIECSYAHDAGSMSWPMGGCSGGHFANCAQGGAYGGCFWPASHLGSMMEQSGHTYNEVIVSSAYIAAQLPGIIEAVFYINDRAAAQKAHQQLREKYGERVAATPLARFGDGVFTPDAHSECSVCY
jgi:hypothetical protein